MQKFIRIAAAVAVALMGVSLLLLLVTVAMQPTIGRWLNYPADVLGVLPRFPLIPALFCCLRLGCVALLLSCCGNKKGGIWLEVIVFICLAMILPAFNSVATYSHQILVGNRMGAAYIAANALVSNIASCCMISAGIGQALAYATCGMSVIFKKMNKKMADGENVLPQ